MKDNSSQLILALGSNIGDRLKNLDIAQQELKHFFGQPISTSKIYESKPVDYLKQPNFLNMVILFEISNKISPSEILKMTQSIEIRHGRKKVIPKGPRSIDIDILYIDNNKISSDDLEIPHPEIHKRDFVIYPLQEIKSSAIKVKVPSPSIKVPNQLRIYDLVSNNCLDN